MSFQHGTLSFLFYAVMGSEYQQQPKATPLGRGVTYNSHLIRWNYPLLKYGIPASRKQHHAVRTNGEKRWMPQINGAPGARTWTHPL